MFNLNLNIMKHLFAILCVAMMAFALPAQTPTTLSPPNSIVWPDTIEIEGCSGGICYQFTIDCDGNVDPKAHYLWTNSSGEVLNEGYAADQSAACLIVDEPTLFKLEVTPSNGPSFSSNIVYFDPLCNQQSVNIEEYVYNLDDTFQVYDILGREQIKPWTELRPGLYVFRSENSVFKALR